MRSVSICEEVATILHRWEIEADSMEWSGELLQNRVIWIDLKSRSDCSGSMEFGMDYNGFDTWEACMSMKSPPFTTSFVLCDFSLYYSVFTVESILEVNESLRSLYITPIYKQSLHTTYQRLRTGLLSIDRVYLLPNHTLCRSTKPRLETLVRELDSVNGYGL